MLRGLAVLCAYPGSALPQEPVPAGLRILAEIDGVDEVRIAHHELAWVHHAWSWPAAVTVQDRSWTPASEPTLRAEPDSPFMPPSVDLAGATLWKVRGRGETTLSFGDAGLSIVFDDGAGLGAATYEVLVTFADAEIEASRAYFGPQAARRGGPREVEVDVAADVDGADAVHVRWDSVRWSHHDNDWPSAVTFNGVPWNPREALVLPAEAGPPIPAFADLSAATLLERRGRGGVQLEATERELAIRFDDRQPGGAAPYRAVVRVPIRPLHRVEVLCGAHARAEGARLRVVREGVQPVELSGQRVLGAEGRAIVALPAGDYRFEVQHERVPDTLVHLVTPRTRIAADGRVALATLETPLGLELPGDGETRVDEIGMRSILPTGEVRWRRSSPDADARLVLSPGQTYRMRVLAARGSMRAALWLQAPSERLRSLRVGSSELVRCSFRWRTGTPPRSRAGLALFYPDGEQELSLVPGAELWTNRRFIELGYWYEPHPKRRVVLAPRGLVLPAAPARHTLVLGGPLQAHASAAVLTNEDLGSPDAKQLWLDLGLQDPDGHAVDLRASSIDWEDSSGMRDGGALPGAPLEARDLERLSDLAGAIRLRASYRLHEPVQVSLAPAPWVAAQSEHVTTEVPPAMEWRTRIYLAKVERSLRHIQAVRGLPLDPAYRVRLAWWLNNGAIGGHGGFTMPLGGLTEDFRWHSHPWALSHELLHGLGYGHNEDMERVDALVQDRFHRDRWLAADDPAFVPDELRR